jgi:CxxC motif-containing protein (DUF1111 family)
MKAGNKIGIIVCVIALIIGSAVGLRLAGQGTPPDAPTGYETPTLIENPGSRSHSNGMLADADFAAAQEVFEEEDGVDKGLGPVYNARSCAECHQTPVTGGSSQIAEFRVGHNDRFGNFVNPTIFVKGGSIPNRSLVNDRATCADVQEHAPLTETIRTFRMSLSVLGDGFVEAIDDDTLKALSASEKAISGGRIAGEFIMVPLAEAPGQERVGRFGWKDQQASLLSFAGDAYLNEQGITSELNPVDTTSICKDSNLQDPEDQEGDIDNFAAFMRGTKAPPPDTDLLAGPDAQAGQQIFSKVGCAICHVSSITTTNGTITIRDYTVPDALKNKTIHPYGDFLLHNIGTGDGIVQNGPQDTANKLRTAPLWGLRTRDRYMHDGLSVTLPNAIGRHRGEASEVSRNYFKLSERQRSQLLAFLNSL